MRLREVDVRFADGVDRRRVVSLGDALVGVLADAGRAELVSLSVSGVDLATFAFAPLVPVAPVPLPAPTLGPTGSPSNTSWPAGTAPVDADDDGAPSAEDCRDAVLAAADGLGAGRVEIVADRVTSLRPVMELPPAMELPPVSGRDPVSERDPA